MLLVIPILSLADSPTQNTGTPTQTPSGPTSINFTIGNPINVNSIPDFLNSIIKNILMPIGAVLAVLMIMYAGFLYVTARGNETKIGEARSALTWAVIGAAILLGAWAISQVITATIGQLQS